MKPLFFLPFLLIFSSCVMTQTLSEDNSELRFTQAWVWEYENELTPENEPGHQGEMVVYFHPELNYWLFNFESFGVSGEMFEWILAKPDGSYLISGKDEFGKSIMWEEKLEFDRNKAIPDYYSPTFQTKIFNENDLGYDEILGKEFKIKYEKTEETSTVFLTEYPQNFLPLYHFNRLNLEAKIPLNFSLDLPENQLVLEEETQTPNGKIKMSLTMISSTEHFIDLADKF